MLLEAALIALSLSIDALCVGFNYGSKNIKIKKSGIFIISFISAAITGIALVAGTVTAAFIPANITLFVAFLVLFFIGIYKLFDNANNEAVKNIEGIEVIVLALSVSIDGVAVGFGAALMEISAFWVVLFSLIANAAAITFGLKIGNRITKAVPFGISWLGGAVLIALAFSKLILQ